MGHDEVPRAEWDTSPDVARALISEQAPAWSSLPLTHLAQGWDNVLYRLGSSMIVRLVRRAAALECVENEQRWLPELAPTLPLPVPMPVFAGRPTERFPYPWSVVPYFPGADAVSAAYDGARVATQLGGFFRCLHTDAPPDAPDNPFRSVRLGSRRDQLDPALEAFDDGSRRRAFELACEAEARHRPRTWLHGDAHPGNLLVDAESISAVVDWGDLCHGDPASDLSCAWMLFDQGDRERFFDVYGADAAIIARARGWAVHRAGLMMVVKDNPPPFADMVRRTWRRVRED